MISILLVNKKTFSYTKPIKTANQNNIMFISYRARESSQQKY